MLQSPSDIELAQLPRRLLSERGTFPETPAVYFVIGAEDQILYIGKARSLFDRWRSHHRILEFKQIEGVRVAWLQLDDESLLESIEEALIQHFAPPLNGAPVVGSFQMTLRLRGFEKERLDEIAEGWGMTLSDAIRRLIRERGASLDRRKSQNNRPTM